MLCADSRQGTGGVSGLQGPQLSSYVLFLTPPAGMSPMAQPAQENGLEFDFTFLERFINLRASYAGRVRRNISPGFQMTGTHISEENKSQ